MVNAALVACEIPSQLPPMETPAHTEGREGFYHLTDMSGDVAAATLSYIIRDHDKVMFETRQKKMQEIADSMNQKYGVGPFEHISVEGMETAVAVIKEIVRITAEL